jgi:hypothetical protein
MSKPIRNTVTAPAMTRQDWEALPEAVRRFIPWERARKPLTVKRVGPPAKAREGYKYFTEGKR